MIACANRRSGTRLESIGTISHIFLPFLPDYHRAHHTKVGRAIQFALSDYDA